MTAPGDRLGSRYEFDEVIGNGAMGQVWRAHDQQGGTVAVKMLHPHLATDKDIRRRFFDESQILTSITHPAVVQVRDVVMEGATLGIVMEYVEGPDLGSELKEHAGHNQRMQEAYAARLGAEIADGLAAIHAAKICHRDVKPANVLLTRTDPGQVDPEATRRSGLADAGGGWHPKITDFGVSKILDSAAATATAFAGTPNYVSPEIILGRAPTPASDLYSFGIMLYEMVAGRTPFAAPSREAVMHAHMAQEPARPDGLSERMWQIISCCLAKDPAGRPASAQVLARELRRLADGQAPGDLLASPGGGPGAPEAAGAAGAGLAATYVVGEGWNAMPSPAPFQQSPGTLVGYGSSDPGVAGQGAPGQPGSTLPGGSYPSPGTSGQTPYPSGPYQTTPYPTAIGASYPGAYPEPMSQAGQMSQPGQPAPMMAAQQPGGGGSGEPKKGGRRWLPLIIAVVAVAVVLGIVFSPIGFGGKKGDEAGGTHSASSSASSQRPSESASTDSPTPTLEPTTAVALPVGAKACTPTVAVGGKNTSCPFAQNVAAAIPADHGDRFDVTAYSPATQKAYTLSCTSGQYVLCTKPENNIEVYVIK
ncbi:Serine/threonine protein kinase [Acidipropionibacterium acidipropionici ATCC 4875]|uniref:non-specific serine/threonine protein kinase n=1 Tax=Acidipropionibacterium acidipropionici (strain ATCC 4875 / DSM 20272 / JCM 6432 / NBRC 12425 / NCIMB 8070 / 4) TaxID=1171373 RepID=K7RSL5_ACIA4|nr:serine/threonine-protein kinase [Acidipropionibacterium acidipropionici]AFV91069.1 Serine/threonine protein kinase [Acidipropionibacterium acidipropionici ATCC 4875]ALN14849.1 hypothetical protein ASQ49_05645 [Acidipropionibacterium acidipropionici]APZ09398.1 serine/threonine protein kinase [Acidipropionibacterium acidipropionici]